MQSNVVFKNREGKKNLGFLSRGLKLQPVATMTTISSAAAEYKRK